MPIRLGSPPPSKAPPPRQPKPRSWIGNLFHGVGWLAAAPVAWLGVRPIARGGRLIGDLAQALRRPPSRDQRFQTLDQGGFDLAATAFSYGMSVAELERRLAARRRQTARIAYATFALAVLFLLAWFWQALSAPMTSTRIISALEFLPFCLLFLLISFYNALVNFQIRAGRTVGWREYLATNQPFLPR